MITPIAQRIINMGQISTKKSFVYELLKGRIISGEMTAGMILNETELSQNLGVGKTPTREALIMLAHDGLVDAMPRVGYVVTRLTMQDMLEIFALRIMLEVEAIGIAAEKITEADLARLVANNREEAGLAKQQADAAVREKGYRLNHDFHLIIAESTGNHRLVHIIQGLIEDLERALSLDPYIADPTQHNEIILYLKNRDKAKAQSAMRKHIEETLNRMVNRF
jgi:DNA-binding GntR family transcriptional regulator